jgi:AcrR family transcriptional regulator
MTSPEVAKASYHHGNLSAALVAIASKAVRSGGAATFSLRHAAGEAEVTPSAVYKHFKSKSALLAAVATQGFQLLGQRVAAAQTSVREDKKLTAVGLAYVAFAADEPQLFSLMFGPSGPGAARDSIRSPRGGAFDALRIGIARSLGISEQDVSPADLALAWAAAHGAARLVTDGLWKRDDPRITMAITRAVGAILKGAPKARGAHSMQQGKELNPIDRKPLRPAPQQSARASQQRKRPSK